MVYKNSRKSTNSKRKCAVTIVDLKNSEFAIYAK